MSIIEDFFNGNIYPYEALKDSAEYRKALGCLNEYLEAVDNKFSNDKESMSDKMRQQISAMEYEHAMGAFALGLSLGMRFTYECCTLKNQ